MRNKQQLADLSQTGQTIVLPKYDANFERFKSKLHDLLVDNFGLAVARTLEYDNHQQVFFVKLSMWTTLPKCEGTPVIRQELTTEVEIDPRTPLLTTFNTIEDCMNRLRQAQ